MAQSHGVDWPNFLGPGYDGKSPETGIRTDWSNGKLPLVWQRELDTSYGIGSVANNRMYLFDRVGDKEVLFCVDAKTGKPDWQFAQDVDYRDMYGYNDGPRGSPTIDGERVYVYGVAGRLSCVNANNGSLIWTQDVNKEFNVIQNFFGVAACPLVMGNAVIVMVGGSPAADLKLPPGQLDRVSPNGSALVAFDKLSGKELWRGGDDTASYSSPIPAPFAKPASVLAFTRSGLLAVNATNGKQLWLYPWRADFLESVNAAVPVVRGNEVMLSECYQIGSTLLKVSPENYEVVRRDAESRRVQSFRAHWATPIEVDGYLYGCSGRNEPDSDLRCVRWSDGEPQWIDPRRIRSSLLYVDGHLVVLEERGLMQLIKATPEKLDVVTEINLGAMNGDDGRPLLTPPCWAAPILSHGLLYVRGENRILCFELIKK